MTEVLAAVDAAAPRLREHVIPRRKSEILDALLTEDGLPPEQRAAFRRFAHVLAAVLHYEYFDELERLRDAYFDFDPDRQPAPVEPGSADAYRALIDEVVGVLTRANFVEVSHAEIERAHAACVIAPVKIKAPLTDFREVRVFRRGGRQESVTVSRFFGLWTRTHPLDVYQDVVLMICAKPAADNVPAKGWRTRLVGRLGLLGRSRNDIRPGAVLFKYFRNVAGSDLHALFPNVRVVFSLRDRLMLGVPAIVGGIPLLIKLASTMTILFLVAGFYLGMSGTVRDDDHKQALGALSGVVALGAFLVRQWGNFRYRSLTHQKQLNDNFYYRNLSNNSSIFDYIIGAAEEQEWKEALLAYHSLLVAPAPLTRAALDMRIEDLLSRRFDLAVDFEIDDALAKLVRFGLLHQDGAHLSAPPLDQALTRLDHLWDDYFDQPDAPLRAKRA